MLLSRNVCNFFLEKQFNSKNLIELKKKEEDYKEVDILAHVMKDEYVDNFVRCLFESSSHLYEYHLAMRNSKPDPSLALQFHWCQLLEILRNPQRLLPKFLSKLAKRGLFAPNFNLFLTSIQGVTGAITPVGLC